MKTVLSALAIGTALMLTGAPVSTADAAPAKKAPTVQGSTDASQATEFSSRHRHRHWHGHRHWRGHRHGYYGPRYYAPRPAYGYGYGRPYGYGYGGPGISFSFGGPRW